MPVGNCRVAGCGWTGEYYGQGHGGYCVFHEQDHYYMPNGNTAPFNALREEWIERYPYDDPCAVDDDSIYDYEIEPEYSGGIHAWDYCPSLNFHGSGPYHLGFELEITASNFNVSPILRWCDDNGVPDLLYVKEDGSVNGFEIVSHPMTPEFFDTVPWAGFFDMLQVHYPHSGRESSGHGLHVHVSRTAFPRTSVLGRWTYLLHRNAEHVQRVARRNSSQWAQFAEYPVSALLPEGSDTCRGTWETDWSNPLECGCCYPRIWHSPSGLPPRITRQFSTHGRSGRYQAVNLTNDATVEVRVFRSTRDVDEFTSSIHFVAASVEFARSMQPCHATRLATSWDAFSDYVRSHPVFAKDAPVFLGESANQVVVPIPVIRRWAQECGYDVKDRGRLGNQVINAFLALPESDRRDMLRVYA